ncbi:MFS transporter [Methanolobus sp. ZRKC2]|uniref:MFS transporter n=1 Tax=Methanolobus sp. ZRKC2 TaxID=3125783 RepID=UPI00324CB475
MRSINRIEIRNLTILLGSTLTILAATIIAPSLPGMSAEFQDLPNAEFLSRLALTIPALIVSLSAPFAGLLLDHWGRKPVLILSLTLYGLAGTSGFVLDSLTGILVSRALLGLAVAGIMSGFITLITDYFTGDRLNQFMGYQGASIALGGMVFLLVAGYLADIGWRFPFLVHLFAFVILLGVLFTIDEPVIKKQSRQQDMAHRKTPFPLKTISLIYATTFIGMLILFIFPVQLPFYLVLQFSASGTQVGMALALQSLASVISALSYRKLKARLSFQIIFGLVFLALGINHLVVALAPTYSLLIVGLLIGGLGFGVFPPNLNVWLAKIVPQASRGRAIGGLTSFTFFGQFFTPILTQPLVQNIGLAGTFGVTAGVSFLLAIAYIFKK